MEPYLDNTISPKYCEQTDQARSVTKDDRLVIMLHGWGADSSDRLACAISSRLGFVSSDTASAHHRGLGSAVFIPDAPDTVPQSIWPSMV